LPKRSCDGGSGFDEQKKPFQLEELKLRGSPSHDRLPTRDVLSEELMAKEVQLAAWVYKT
jgi:hypothetical protein